MSSRALLNCSLSTRSAMQTRLMSTSAMLMGGKDIGPDRTHLLDKNENLNPQSEASAAARKERGQENEKESQAISQTDHGASNKKAKKDHPKAPEPVIGMNDERGGKGH